MVSTGIGNRITETASYLYKIARRYIHLNAQVEILHKTARLSNNADRQEDEKKQ